MEEHRYTVSSHVGNIVEKMLSDKTPDNVVENIFHELGLVSVLCRQAGGELRSRQVIAAVVAKHLLKGS